MCFWKNLSLSIDQQLVQNKRLVEMTCNFQLQILDSPEQPTPGPAKVDDGLDVVVPSAKSGLIEHCTLESVICNF